MKVFAIICLALIGLIPAFGQSHVEALGKGFANQLAEIDRWRDKQLDKYRDWKEAEVLIELIAQQRKREIIEEYKKKADEDWEAEIESIWAGGTSMVGGISTLEVPLASLQRFDYNGTTYFYTHQTIVCGTRDTIVYCEFVDNKFVMHLMHTFIQSFEIVDFVFFFDTGAIDVGWKHVGSYPFRNTKHNSVFKNNKKVIHVFKAYGITPPTRKWGWMGVIG